MIELLPIISLIFCVGLTYGVIKYNIRDNEKKILEVSKMITELNTSCLSFVKLNECEKNRDRCASMLCGKIDKMDTRMNKLLDAVHAIDINVSEIRGRVID